LKRSDEERIRVSEGTRNEMKLRMKCKSHYRNKAARKALAVRLSRFWKKTRGGGKTTGLLLNFHLGDRGGKQSMPERVNGGGGPAKATIDGRTIEKVINWLQKRRQRHDCRLGRSRNLGRKNLPTGCHCSGMQTGQQKVRGILGRICHEKGF